MHTVNPLLGPVVALVAWTFVMMFWMAAIRFTLLKGRDIPAGSRGSDMPPGPHNWPAHNYVHLVEQPTLFYAIVLALVAMGDSAALSLALAWAYVALRVVHSIWQSTRNIVKVRLMLFALSSLCLIALTIHAARIVIRG